MSTDYHDEIPDERDDLVTSRRPYADEIPGRPLRYDDDRT